MNGLKRKTLAERAGEPTGRPAPAPPSSRLVSAHVRATSLASVSRDSSFSSSVSSRQTSGASMRNVSNNSYSSSVGTRPSSGQSYRPQSAMATPSHLQKSVYTIGRPATSLEVHEEEPGIARTVGKRKGRTPLSSCPNPPEYPVTLQSPRLRGRSLRGFSLNSLNTKFNTLSLKSGPSQSTPKVDVEVPPTPSYIPKLVPQVPLPTETPSPSKSPKKTPRALKLFLNRTSNDVIAWDTDSRLEEVENMCSQFKESMDGATTESKGLKEIIGVYKIRIAELEAIRTTLTTSNTALQADLDAIKTRVAETSEALDDAKRYHNIRLDDMQRQHNHDLDDVRHNAETERRSLFRDHTEKLEDVRRTLENALEEEKTSHQREVQALSTEGASTQREKEKEMENQRSAFAAVEKELDVLKTDVAREREVNGQLRVRLAESATRETDLETSVRRLEGHIHFLESDNKSQSQAFADLEMRMQNAIQTAAEAMDKLRTEETLRRKLHNQVQELKGNIRVFCRVRPSLESDPVDAFARIVYPDDETDSKEVEVMGAEEKSSLGTITTKKHPFAFDRVFGPESRNQDVFGEISQLVQSALDGYNVCIFCYGQTGSGKTYTMSANDGMIPLAVNQIYETAKSLEEKEWQYKMEGSFIEVYNEELNDLLGKANDMDKKKHEIKHDMAKGKTTITNITTVDLDAPSKVNDILERASNNRSVASTKANERSSRSHSVFILRLIGENSITGEKSEGTLNLVDLAGSERLNHSGAVGERLKETQNINKSLSCLGDVIGALGQGKEGGHVPYRNSKLTYLLQTSLGGNSKTLMFVMISPLQAHLSETLTSLKFATKVHNTHIGTARKQTKTRDA
ncbi:MAG: kinesin-like nuclear fusion protein [Alectoria sarmentosa]|nr:MAG: kinesin-like nuclear fusion protein [Alectoria sarmentosa]